MTATKTPTTDVSDEPSVKLQGVDPDSSSGSSNSNKTQPESAAPAEPTSLATDAEFKALVEQANTGDAIALRKLREILDANPQIWH